MSNNPVFLAARNDAEAAARDLSQKHSISIEVRWITPQEEEAKGQVVGVRVAVKEGVDAILISCSDATLRRERIQVLGTFKGRKSATATCAGRGCAAGIRRLDAAQVNNS